MNFTHLFGRMEFAIPLDGTDSSGLLNTLHRRGVHFISVTREENMLSGSTDRRSAKLLASTAEEFGTTCSLVRKGGVVHYLDRFSRRTGIFIGIVLCAAIPILLSDRVMVIDIGGCEKLSEAHILSLLEDAGIYIGSSISSTDLRCAEREIMGMDKDIAWVGLRHTGSRVVCEIQELDPLPELEKLNSPSNIVATADCQLTDIRLYSGMLIPMIGDGVKKGDIIVSGIVDTKYGRSYYVHSMASVTGRYTQRMTFSESLVRTEKKPSGTVTRKEYSIFGRRFSLNRTPVEGDHTVTEQEYRPSIGRISLPFAVITSEYTLLEDSETVIDAETAAAMIEERIGRYEKNFIPEDTVIIDKQAVRTDERDKITVTVEYLLEGEVGCQRELFAHYEGSAPELKFGYVSPDE